MSTPQGAAQSTEPPAGARGTNVFTRKVGPLPLWAWMGIGLAIALGYYFWKQNSGKGGSNTANTAAPDQTTAASQIPQFVNQTFVQGTPPATPTTSPTPPVGTKPPTNAVPANTYAVTTNGKETLATIAKKQGVSVSNIAMNTDQLGGGSNHGAFWKWYSGSSNHGTKGKVPAGITLFFQDPKSPNKYAHKVTAADASS